MSAGTRPGRFWMGLASSLSVAACLAESAPSGPPGVATVDMANPGTEVPTPVPSPDGPEVDVVPPSPETIPDAAPRFFPPCLGPAGVLLVVGDNDDLEEDDEILADLLFERGNFFVTVADDEDDPVPLLPDVVNCSKGVAVISSTVDPATLADRYRTIQFPVVVTQARHLAAMGMTASSAEASGTSRATDIVLRDSIGDVFAPGPITVAPRTIRLSYGVPAASATVIATLRDEAGRAAIFTYQPGATMATLAAPHRRAAFFTDQYGRLTEEGQTLFETTIYWAAFYVTLNR
jgi:hypothetical protein